MRLFVASPAIIDDYTSIKEDFKDIINGKWTEEDHLHFTWVFLGEAKEIKPIIEQLNNITPLVSKMEISGLGYFNRPSK